MSEKQDTDLAKAESNLRTVLDEDMRKIHDLAKTTAEQQNLVDEYERQFKEHLQNHPISKPENLKDVRKYLSDYQDLLESVGAKLETMDELRVGGWVDEIDQRFIDAACQTITSESEKAELAKHLRDLIEGWKKHFMEEDA